jgi:hypothetical protein
MPRRCCKRRALFHWGTCPVGIDRKSQMLFCRLPLESHDSRFNQLGQLFASSVEFLR